VLGCHGPGEDARAIGEGGEGDVAPPAEVDAGIVIDGGAIDGGAVDGGMIDGRRSGCTFRATSRLRRTCRTRSL
jgi:hypothetical protein